MRKILKGYTFIAFIIVAFNVYECIFQKVSMKSGIIFIIEGLLGIVLISRVYHLIFRKSGSTT